ncbi:MAG: universal stress protein, partial [Myxococcota bacterium]
MVSTILMATDGSKAAVVAERHAVTLANRLKARLLGISVIEDCLARGFREDGLGVAPPPADAVASYLKSRAEAACRRLAERARSEGVESQCETAQGIADDLIVERGQQADLLV